MWPHGRVAWWDAKRWLALRGRRIAGVVALTALAGSGLAAYEYYDARPVDPRPRVPPASSDAPAVEPTIPWSNPGGPPSSLPPLTTATFVSPTQPWPGSTP